MALDANRQQLWALGQRAAFALELLEVKFPRLVVSSQSDITDRHGFRAVVDDSQYDGGAKVRVGKVDFIAPNLHRDAR
jgi:hypothetical protein